MIISLVLIIQSANAGPIISISTLAFNDELHYNSRKFRPAIIVGYNKEYKNYVASIYTNRLNHSQKRSLENGLDVKSKVKSDIFKLGKRYGRYIYSGFVTNTMVKNTVFSPRKEHFISYGLSTDYLITKKISVGFGCVMPSKLGHGCFTNLSYNF